jgi:hypothetical protein
MRVSDEALDWAIKWERFDNTGDAWLDLRDARAQLQIAKDALDDIREFGDAASARKAANALEQLG